MFLHFYPQERELVYVFNIIFIVDWKKICKIIRGMVVKK